MFQRDTWTTKWGHAVDQHRTWNTKRGSCSTRKRVNVSKVRVRAFLMIRYAKSSFHWHNIAWLINPTHAHIATSKSKTSRVSREALKVVCERIGMTPLCAVAFPSLCALTAQLHVAKYGIDFFLCCDYSFRRCKCNWYCEPGAVNGWDTGGIFECHHVRRCKATVWHVFVSHDGVVFRSLPTARKTAKSKHFWSLCHFAVCGIRWNKGKFFPGVRMRRAVAVLNRTNATYQFSFSSSVATCSCFFV